MISVVSVKDAAALADIHALCFDRPWSADDIAKMFDNPALSGLAVRAGQMVGFALFWTAAGDGEILTVAVRPDQRRRGVGEELLSAVVAAALARGARTVHLDVAEDNVAARALYAKTGFQEAGRRRGYYLTARGQLDAIVMRLTLAPD